MSKNFIADLKNLADFQTYRKNTAEKIKSHNLPVIIFGAGDMARNVTDNLKNFDVEISGYAVDEKYFVADKKLNGLPIYNFDELRKTPDKYIFVVGASLKVRYDDFMNDSSITKYYFCMDRVDTITFDYMIANQAKFIETYNLLADDFSKQTMSAYLKAHLMAILLNNLLSLYRAIIGRYLRLNLMRKILLR